MASDQSREMPSILIIDDQAGIRRTLEMLFQKEDFRVLSLDGAASIRETLASFRPDIVLTDLRMEPVSGLEVLREVRSSSPDTSVILMTAFGSIAAAVEAMKLGAVDFITKPFRNEDLLVKVSMVLGKRDTPSKREVERYSSSAKTIRSAKAEPDPALVAHSVSMRAVMAQVEKVAGGGLTVLLTGETGTGKSMIARAIHQRSPYASGPFIPINAAALPEPLLESELFGHEKGAFTGASSSRQGLFEEAEGGTLFLDEIGALPTNLQSKLLGVLQDRQVRRVGGNRIVNVNVRVIAATNVDLEEAVARGNFRRDLYYRLNVARIRLPPLREHLEDLPYLLKGMLQELSQGRPFQYAMSPEALTLVNQYSFQGNVRELRNAMEWAVTVAQGPVIEARDLPEALWREVETLSVDETASHGTLAQMERDQIVRAIQKLDGNLSEVAKALEIGRTTLWRKMREYGIKK